MCRGVGGGEQAWTIPPEGSLLKKIKVDIHPTLDPQEVIRGYRRTFLFWKAQEIDQQCLEDYRIWVDEDLHKALC